MTFQNQIHFSHSLFYLLVFLVFIHASGQEEKKFIVKHIDEDLTIDGQLNEKMGYSREYWRFSAVFSI